MKFKILLGLYALLFTGLLKGQVNLVPNPSFESYTLCPSTYGQWNVLSNWYSPNELSSDYFNSCDIFNAVGVPNNVFGYQPAYEGNAYCGWACSFDTLINPDYREYMQVQLTEPLIAGEAYIVSAYVAKADSAPIVVRNIGIALSAGPITGSVSGAIINFTPQIKYSSFLTNSTQWTLISDTILATGGENYLTIGFFSSDPMDVNVIGNSYVAYKICYYYTDMVSVIKKQTANVNSIFFSDSLKVIFNDNKLRIEKSNSDKITVEIFDAFGAKVFSIEITDSSVIDLGNLSSGIYTARFNNQTSVAFKRLLIF